MSSASRDITVVAAESATALKRFLATYCGFYGRLPAELKEAILELIEIFVRAKLQYRPNEEIEFRFERSSTSSSVYYMKTPAPVVGLVTCLTNAGETLIALSEQRMLLHELTKSDGAYALRVTPTLITFGGTVIWTSED